jgi:tetratricopeptide (TPR) repeat protein
VTLQRFDAGDSMTNEPNSSSGWNRVASELRAYRELQRKAWGDTDNALLGRYLADEVDPHERQKVEAALDEHPELRQLTDLVREVLGECEANPAAQPEEPDVLPFAPPKVTAKRATFRPGRRLGWLVAACLLVGVGIPLAAWLWPGNRPESQAPGGLVVRSFPSEKEGEPGKPLLKVSDRASGREGEKAAKDPLHQTVASAVSAQRVAEFERWLNQGQAEMERQRFDAAARAFNQAVATLDAEEKADGNSGVVPGGAPAPAAAPVPPERALRARQLASYSLNMQSGESALKEARYDEAVKAYSEALRFQPKDRLATDQVRKAKELAAIHVVLKPVTAVPPHRIEDAVGNLHPFAASLMKQIRTISEKGWPTAKKTNRK